MKDDYNEYKCKLFDIINAINNFWTNTLKNEWVILIGEKHPKVIKHFM